MRIAFAVLGVGPRGLTVSIVELEVGIGFEPLTRRVCPMTGQYCPGVLQDGKCSALVEPLPSDTGPEPLSLDVKRF